jgi:hypothetical protein
MGYVPVDAVIHPHQWSELHGVPTVGVHAVPGPFRHQGEGDDPAHVGFLGEVATEPISTGPASSIQTRCVLCE